MIEDILKRNQIKVTFQRVEILNTINALGEKATLKEIIKNCKKKVDQSTIHRSIEFMLNKKIIAKNINCHDEIYYQIKGNHEHYIHCIKCHKNEKIDICPILNIEEELKTKGYKEINHEFHVEGICSTCQKDK